MHPTRPNTSVAGIVDDGIAFTIFNSRRSPQYMSERAIAGDCSCAGAMRARAHDWAHAK